MNSLKILNLDKNSSKKAAEIGSKLSREGRQNRSKRLAGCFNLLS